MATDSSDSAREDPTGNVPEDLAEFVEMVDETANAVNARAGWADAIVGARAETGPNPPSARDGQANGCLSGMVIAVTVALLGGAVAAFGFGLFSSGGSNSDGTPEDGARPPAIESSGAELPDNTQTRGGGSGGGAGSGPTDNSEAPAGPALVPITGDWVMSSQEGSFGCDSQVELGGDSAIAFIEVSPSGDRIVVTDYDDGSPIALDLIDGSPNHATYYRDLTEIVGFQFEMSMTFDSPTTVGGRYEGCPDRVGLGYLLEARDTPGDGGIVTGPTLGVETSCEEQLAAIDGALRADPGAVIDRPDLDELQACLTPFNGLIIVEGLPDLSGVYYTASEFGRSWGADMAITLGTCAVADGGAVFQTDITVEATQIWVGLQEPNEPGDTDNAQVGVLRLRENGPPSHIYTPLAHREGGAIEVRTKGIPGENPWGGWAVISTPFFNEADFFPYGATSFEGEPTYGGTFTLVCG